jgi:serine/threonine protein kinase/tetratricopeptide (TPR) repeat protein
LPLSTQECDPVPQTEVDQHFDHVLELEPQARATWLAAMSVTRPEIAQEIHERLKKLAALDAAGFLLDSPYSTAGTSVPPLHELLGRSAGREGGEAGCGGAGAGGFAPGAIVGPYRLLREVGAGGMSIVWLAERCDGQLKREVALKLPLLGPRMHVERFVLERDILAALTHPNIARLYDAGISDSRQPYLAMEYIAGTALIHRCDTQNLTVDVRLRLFVQVLEAVQFAHAKLIIHRDLKPSNILVTNEGRVVLLDFGIGKLLTDGPPEETPLTQMAGRALTPDYASPEQIAGQPLGTASDIYSLGVVLYELLTGSRPYKLRRDSRGALEEAILHEDVRRPSHADIAEAIAVRRGTSVKSLVRSLRGDLDTIVLKALKKNPLERYASVTAFSQDINNHLQRLPVSARPDSAWYRVGRFVSRHRTPVIAAGVAAGALLGGAVVAIWQAKDAAAERDRAVAFASRNEAVTDFLGRVIAEAAESPEPVTVGEMLERSAALALGDTSGSPENRAAILEMISDRYMSTDEMEQGTQLIKKAVALVGHSPDQALRSRLTCKQAAATAGADTDSAESVRIINGELKQLEREPGTAGECLLHLSRIHAAQHHAADALRNAALGLERIRQVPHASGLTEAALLGALAVAYNLSGSNVEADRYFQQAQQKYKTLGRERTDGALTVTNDWAVMLGTSGMPRRALQLLDEEARIEVQRQAGAEPSGTVIGNRAYMLRAMGRYGAARTAYERECQLATRHKDDFSQVHCLLGLAALDVDTHAWNPAAARVDRAIGLLGSNIPADSPPMRVGAVLRGRIATATGRFTEAQAQFESALAKTDISPTTFFAEIGLADMELAAGNAAAAEQHARRGLEWAGTLQGKLPQSYQTGLAWLTLGRVLRRVGDPLQARKAFEEAVTQLGGTVEADHPSLLQARQLLSTS